MNSKSTYRLSPQRAFIPSVIFYVLLVIFLFPYYQHQLDPDGISYIGIAQKYLAGDFSNAINGCWGPMISWLLVPFLAVGFKPLVGFKMLTSIIGLFTLHQCYKTLQEFDVDTKLFLPALLCLVIIILNFALTLVAPDMLFAFLGMCYVNLLLKYNRNQDSFLICILLGVIGAMLFFTKNYGLPFFVVSYSLMSLVIFTRNQDKNLKTKLLMNYIVGIVVFGLLSFIWIYLISVKYGYWTFGTAGHYNHRVFGPQSLGHPMYYVGLLEPSNPTATTVMEDFSFIQLPEWTATDWMAYLKFYVSRIQTNLFAYFKILNDFSFTTSSILVGAIIYLFQRGKRFLYNNVFVVLLVLFVLASGYILLVIEHRYLWLYNLLLVIISSYFLTRFFQTFQLKKSAKAVLLVMLYGSLLLYPGITLSRNFDKGLDFYNHSQQLQKLGVKGKIATKGTWYGGAVMAYYTGSQFYGTCAHTAPQQVAEELAKFEIDYLIVWRNAYSELDDEYFENITNGSVGNFEVYRVR